MSPASSGPLEVERYIGACLISSRTKNNPQNASQANTRDIYYPRERYPQLQRQDLYNNQGCPLNLRRNNNEGWTGMPLISFANNHRRTRKEHDTRSSSPRVLEEPTSALSQLAVHTQGVPLILSNRHGSRRNKNNTRNNIPQKIEPIKKDNTRPVDSISIASDESSGSNNSETCLPRIIKPRKRRKKDRKPHNRTQNESGASSIVTLKPYVPFCFKDKVYPPKYNEISEKSIVPLPFSDDLSETPKLHHNFEDVKGSEVENEAQLSLCQCRYCDPSGQIWDVDRHCYSPFLTTPTFSSSSPILVDRISSTLEHLSSFSFDTEVEDEKEVDRCFEISTEIVTSANGHRDLEIRLFSAKSIKTKDKWDNERLSRRFTPEE